MKKPSWEIVLGIVLIISSVVLYFAHFLIFKDAHHIFIYLLGDIAFIPMDVLIVTLIIHKVLVGREKHQIMEKMNMVIGAFFSEVGSELLEYLVEFDGNLAKIRNNLIIGKEWTNKDFLDAKKKFKNYDYIIDKKRGDLQKLLAFLKDRRVFLLRLLENPILLEHQGFTNLLWAVFHFSDELTHRKDIKNLPDSDYEHLMGDIKRVYVLLIEEWLDYMKHLQKKYPYLFSLALRTNPFDSDADVVIK
ncbi:MAG: hypothetical protein ABID32_00735 [Candidatus Omnitrophota bacterium]